MPGPSPYRRVVEACEALGRPAAATGAVRFASPEDYEVHRALRAVGEQSTIWQARTLSPPRAWLRPAGEAASLFAGRPPLRRTRGPSSRDAGGRALH